MCIYTHTRHVLSYTHTSSLCGSTAKRLYSARSAHHLTSKEPPKSQYRTPFCCQKYVAETEISQCNTLHHTATHRYRTSFCSNKHVAETDTSHCNMLHHAATHLRLLGQFVNGSMCFDAYTTHCNTLQQITATHGDTATHLGLLVQFVDSSMCFDAYTTH